MTLYQNSYRKYIESLDKTNLHSDYKTLFNSYYETLNDNPCRHYIFYGPPGVGKYSQLLYFLSLFSKSKLSYEKKITIQINKTNEYITKISDVHYEIDISLLGCNSKSSFHAIYNEIVNILSVMNKSTFQFIVCKNFHMIHPELLEVFYAYITNTHTNVKCQFILLTESLSFIPDSILELCKIFKFKRPTLSSYKKIQQSIKYKDVNNITNIKDISQNLNNSDITYTNVSHITYTNSSDITYTNDYEICNDIINKIHNIDQVSLFDFRENIYKLLIMQLNIETSIFYILEHLFDKNIIQIKKDKQTHLFNATKYFKIQYIFFDFYKYYQNNYRCIYHLEKLFLNLSKIVNDY